MQEDRVEEELPLRSGHDIPVRDRRKGKTATLVGRMLQTQENNQHHERNKTRGQHPVGFISSADRKHRGETAQESAWGSSREGRHCSRGSIGAGLTWPSEGWERTLSCCMNNERTRVRPHGATALLALSCGFYVATRDIPSHSSTIIMDASFALGQSIWWSNGLSGSSSVWGSTQLVTLEFHTRKSLLFDKNRTKPTYHETIHNKFFFLIIQKTLRYLEEPKTTGKTQIGQLINHVLVTRMPGDQVGLPRRTSFHLSNSVLKKKKKKNPPDRVTLLSQELTWEK